MERLDIFRKDRTNNNVIQHCLCRMSERSVSLNDFDINLLETLLKRFVNLESDVKMWLSTIRETRNHIAHVTSTTDFDPGRLDKWWKMLEGSILGLVKKIQPAFYAKSIESQINILKNSNLEAIYGKKLMDDVNAENKILLEDLAERNDTRIVECENNIKQAILENNNELKQHIAEVKGDFMRKLEELEAMVKGSAKEDPNTNLRSELDSTRKIHVACQVEADDIDEHLTIKNLSNPDKVAANQSDDKDFKIVDVKQKCILLELTASPEILSSEECLLNAIDQLINQVVLAGDLDTRVPGKMTLNLSFTSPLSREELDVFSRVFRTTDKTEIIDSDVMNQIQDYSFGTITRETQTEITTEDNACQVDMMCKWCATNDHHSNQFWDDCLINSNESSLEEGSPAEFPVIPWNIGADVLPVDTYTTEREFQHEYYLGDSFYIDGIIKDVKILDKNKIIIASYEKKQLVVFELNNCIEMHIPLREDPSKLAVINPNTVAIIMRCVNYVLIFDITERVPLNSLYIGSTCCGIAYLNKRLYVGCKDETIKVLSLDGEIKVMIEVQDTEIHNICVSKTQNLYCTNYLNDKLICIDTNSEMVNSIHNSRLQRPRGITMDENDNIVVACHRSTEILRLSYDGKQATKIMDTETFNGFPCICCDLETGSLIIGGYDTVFVYRKNRNLKI